jgi:hypothetical protein
VIVLEIADTGCISVGRPHIEIAVAIPIDGSEGAPVVGVIEAGQSGSRCELIFAGVQEAAISLATTERTALSHHLGKLLVSPLGFVRTLLTAGSFGTRHDLSPKE